MLRVLAVWLLIASPALAQDDVYSKVAPGTVLIYDGGSIGSGLLVDAQRRLVVTAEHVIRPYLRANNNNVPVIFPLYEADGSIMTDAVAYRKQWKRMAIMGKVIYYNRTKDVAIIELPNLPAKAQVVPLASKAPRPGDRIHVIGNSTLSDGGAFGYSVGNIRNLHYFTRPSFIFFSVTHHAPSNRGDSGGPVVNDRGELVGIISQGTTGGQNQQIVDHSVHVSEIRRAFDGIQQPGGTQIVCNFAVDSDGLDSIFLPVQNQQTLSLSVEGNGRSDLDLLAEDFDFFDFKTKKQGRYLFIEEGLTDKERGQFTANWTGYVRIGIKNLPNKDQPKTPILPVNQMTFSLKSSVPLSGPITFNRRLAAKSVDQIRLYYEAGKGRGRLMVRGDGDTDIDLAVLDPNNQKIAESTGLSDREQVTWNPAVSGFYTVQVRNLGTIWNNYILCTD